METSGWFGVRCVFKIDSPQEAVYEERVTVWRADSPEEAIELAEAEAAKYVDGLDAEHLGLAQVYAMADELVAGAEVFSLMRTSSLESTGYLKTYFDTGAERQTDMAVRESSELNAVGERGSAQRRRTGRCAAVVRQLADGASTLVVVLPTRRLRLGRCAAVLPSC